MVFLGKRLALKKLGECVQKGWFYISMTSRDRKVTFYIQMSYKQSGRGYRT